MSELIYVRFKRQKQTVFLWCNPSETTLKAKERLAKIVDRDPADIKLYGADKVSHVYIHKDNRTR